MTGARREEQREFIGFRSHHLFESRFCRLREAHEKGMIENLVGYARRNFLVPLPKVAFIEELNTTLQERYLTGLDRELRGRGQAWKEERVRPLMYQVRLPSVHTYNEAFTNSLQARSISVPRDCR